MLQHARARARGAPSFTRGYYCGLTGVERANVRGARHLAPGRWLDVIDGGGGSACERHACRRWQWRRARALCFAAG